MRLFSPHLSFPAGKTLSAVAHSPPGSRAPRTRLLLLLLSTSRLHRRAPRPAGPAEREKGGYTETSGCTGQLPLPDHSSSSFVLFLQAKSLSCITNTEMASALSLCLFCFPINPRAISKPFLFFPADFCTAKLTTR